MSATPTTPDAETPVKKTPRALALVSSSFTPTALASSPSPLGEMKISLAIPYSSLEFGRSLGEGSFGEVFQGRWNYNEVAIKVFKNKKFTAMAMKEFKQEAEIMVKMRSDYIVQLRGLCETPSYCLVMEYMPQGSLYDLLHNGQDIPWHILMQIGLDVAYGLAQLHEVQILHRDLKSFNILLDDHLRAKLADFGLSRVKAETRTTASSSKAGGTLAWMAPELMSLKPKYSPQSDMYSYGLVLWELAARELPFKDALPAVFLAELKAGTAKEEISKEVKRERPEFAQLIQDCWQGVGKRPSAAEAVKRLEVLYQTEAKGKTAEVKAFAKETGVPVLTSGLVEKHLPSSSALSDKVSASGLLAAASTELDAEIKTLLAEKEQLIKQQQLEALKLEVKQLKQEAVDRQQQKSQEVQSAQQLEAMQHKLQEEQAARPKAEAETVKLLEEQKKQAAEIAHLKAEQVRVTTEVAAAKLKVDQETKQREKQLLAIKQSKVSVTSPAILGKDSPLLSVAKQSVVDAKTVELFLKHVVEGEQDAAEALLKKHPEIALQKGSVTDLSKREFKQITGFQYALWALDWHMWKMLLQYMSKEEAALQFAELEEKGTAHGKHFSLSPLIEALNSYVKNFDAWYEADVWDKMETHWCKVIGGNQLLLPVSMINEYCEGSRGFYPCPKFNEERLKRHREIGSGGDWFVCEYHGGKLGETFGVLRYNFKAAVAVGKVSADRRFLDGSGSSGDAEALQSLSKMRLGQLETLKSDLAKQLKPSHGTW